MKNGGRGARGRGMKCGSPRWVLLSNPSPPPRGRGPQFELSGVAARRGLSRSGGHTIRRFGLLAACLLALLGCTSPSDTKGPLTIVLKHAKILGPVDPIPALLAEFESAHPGIRVKAEVLPWTSDEQRQFLVINLEGGQPGFALMMLDCIWVPEFARAGWILDLTAGLSPEELSAHFPSAVE